MNFLEGSATELTWIRQVHSVLPEIVPRVMGSKHLCVLLSIMNEHTFGGVGELATQNASVKKVSSKSIVLAKCEMVGCLHQLKVFSDPKTMLSIIGILQHADTYKLAVMAQISPSGENLSTSGTSGDTISAFSLIGGSESA